MVLNSEKDISPRYNDPSKGGLFNENRHDRTTNLFFAMYYFL